MEYLLLCGFKFLLCLNAIEAKINLPLDVCFTALIIFCLLLHTERLQLLKIEHFIV